MKKSHEVDYQVFGDDLQFVEIELDPKEKVIAEAGAMMYMEQNVGFETKMGDGSNPSGGFLGALGPDGCDVSLGNRNRLSFVGYDDKNRKEKWSELVNLLSQESLRLKKKGAELIILLLHGGGEEDERLAKKVPHLDVILAGHTHEKYFKKVNDVLISQAGSYGRFLGELSFEIGESGLIKESVSTSPRQVK